MKKSSIGLLVALGVGYLVLKGRQADTSLSPTPSPILTPMLVEIRFAPLAGIAPVTVNFEASWSNATLPFVNIRWNFGDGDISQFLNPSHTYRSANSYVVSVELQDSAGRTGTGHTTVSVLAPPFVAPPPSAPEQVYVTPTVEEIPIVAWQPAPEFSEGQVAYTTDKPAGVQVGGTASDGAPLTYYYIDGKLVGVRTDFL